MPSVRRTTEKRVQFAAPLRPLLHAKPAAQDPGVLEPFDRRVDAVGAQVGKARMLEVRAALNKRKARQTAGRSKQRFVVKRGHEKRQTLNRDDTRIRGKRQRFKRPRSWTGQDFYFAPEVWADSRETCTTLGGRPHLARTNDDISRRVMHFCRLWQMCRGRSKC